MEDFPRMVYKDIEKDGDVDHPSNHKIVGSLAELEQAFADGWRSHPEEAVAMATELVPDSHKALLARLKPIKEVEQPKKKSAFKAAKDFFSGEK